MLKPCRFGFPNAVVGPCGGGIFESMKVILAFFVNTLCNFAIGLLVAKFLGPDEFGRFALAMSVGVVLQTALLDWLRFATVRFYSRRSRTETPDLRATLDLMLMLIAAFIGVAAITYQLAGPDFTLPRVLIGLAAALSIANGWFDYQTALVRGRFDDQLYGRLILTKNLLALVLTAGGAYLFGRAEITIIGVCASMVGSVFIARTAMQDHGARLSLANRARAASCFGYAAPIVAAAFLYLLIPLTNRALVAHWDGFNETGQFSLAYDIGTRVVGAIGTALDILLFQIAVRLDEAHGESHGRDQVARNIGLVFAILAPTCAGFWLILPSIEQIVVPLEFRGPFEKYFTLLLGGLFCVGMINFAINPVFQIVKRTAPLIAAAAIALLADLTLIALLPHNAESLAIALSGAMLAGLVTLMILAALSGAHWPRARDVVLTLFATFAMAAALLPLRMQTPGIVTLLCEVAAGGAIQAALIALFDIAGLRTLAVGAWRDLRTAATPG